MENEIFWSEIGSGFGEPGGIPPPRITRSTPRREIRPKAGELSHVPNLMQISTNAIDSVVLKKLTPKTVAKILLVANVGSLEKRSNQLKY